MLAVSITLQTLRISGATCHFCQCAAIAELSTPCGGHDDRNDDFRIGPGRFLSTPPRMISRAANHDRLAAKSRLMRRRQSSPKRSWLGPTKLVRQHDKVRRLALGALLPIAFLFEAPAGVVSLPAPTPSKSMCEQTHAIPTRASGWRALFPCRPNRSRSEPQLSVGNV